jgi:predicted cupin superfamily sugar epimerase
MKPASYWIEKYNLQNHQEGGFFTETDRSEEFIATDCLPERFAGKRSFSTGIYFILVSTVF